MGKPGNLTRVFLFIGLMNNYIELDGHKYVTPFGKWVPVIDKPSTARITLDGDLDVTYGPATWKKWQGMI
jgi:hypothetical protein